MKISKINEIKLIFLLAVALVIFISLISFDPDDIGLLTSNPNISKSNIVGSVGAHIAWFLFFLVGYGAFILPFFIALGAVTFYVGEKPEKFYLRIAGIIFSVLSVSAIFSRIGIQGTSHQFHRGGIVGLSFSDFLIKYLGSAGTFIVIAVLLLLSLLISTDFLVFPLVGWIPRLLKSIWRAALGLPGYIRKRYAAQRGVSRKIQKPRVRPVVLKPDKVRVAVSPVKAAVSVTGKPAVIQHKDQEPKPPYMLPSIDLLNSPPPLEEREIKQENVDENSRKLEETLEDFGVEAKVVSVSEGPVITMYELKPARGVTVNRITSLCDNISLAMKSVNIRVVAPIPGKGTIGIEVPNLKSSLVYLKDILESAEYKGSDSVLKLALGKDISGKAIVADLNDMPHLLIAGATGSGKTVCVNSVITALLINATPEQVKFVMVDPKRVELAAFNNLPHLLAPVVTEPKKVSHTLNWVVNEMESRYETFAGLGVRNIDGYNKKAKLENLEPIPYIVVIIDELADLMLVAQNEVENTITRLAQLSRAVGIHMIIATQRPSVDVITGVIKANLPARISFKVASKVDSRTVIDMNGADKLLGKGDMLFVEPGNPKPIRAQGCLVSDEEIHKIADFIRTQRQAEFEEDILKTDDKPKMKKFEKDEVYEEAVRLVMQTRQASVSMLQRRMGIGYTRAARIIDMMEDDNVVGPYQGSKPREIIVESMSEEEV